jgi:hypothetical protein
MKQAKIQGSDERIDKRRKAILNIDFFLYWIILGLRSMEVLNFVSLKWVYMLKSVEKWLWKPRYLKQWLNYSSILKFWKKVTATIFFLWIDVYKSKVSNDLDENWLNYGTFVSGGHLDFIRHFQLGGISQNS